MNTLSGKELMKIGYPEGRAVGAALNAVIKLYKRHTKEEVLEKLGLVLADPAMYREDETFGKVAKELLPVEKPKNHYDLVEKKQYTIYGADQIEQGAIDQMDVAMSLPVSVAGSLMPDAHQGYGLPIGGVLATENAVIPYGVGVDIGCRMCLTVLPMDAKFMSGRDGQLEKILNENTRFGFDLFDKPKDHEVIDRGEFGDIKMLKSLKDKARMQLGSSGSGNHFVEFGTVTLGEGNHFGVAAGAYVAVLSHSGSRGLGANIAKYYTNLAKESCRLPSHAGHLAWLSLDSQEGQEYWAAMNLAGDYASACHHQIHDRIMKTLGESALVRVENHHNFAWKETHGGRDLIVHRKGATPAAAGELGIIPGSMSTPGFIVMGKGSELSLSSASHGAGRLMSRTKAKQSITKKMLRDELKRAGVTLVGGGLDEATFAYKDIHSVMQQQGELVEVVGEFMPRIVRMCSDDSEPED